MITESLRSIFAVFVDLARQPDLKYAPCERMLWDFHNNGFTADDLRCLLRFSLHQNSKREPKYRDRIQFHRILGDLETFNSKLAEARAWERNLPRPVTDRESVLRATGREEQQPERLLSIKDVLKEIVQ